MTEETALYTDSAQYKKKQTQKTIFLSIIHRNNTSTPAGSSNSITVSLLTLPISDVQDTTIVLGTVVDKRTREVMLMGLLGLFGSTPFLVGGR